MGLTDLSLRCSGERPSERKRSSKTVSVFCVRWSPRAHKTLPKTSKRMANSSQKIFIFFFFRYRLPQQGAIDQTSLKTENDNKDSSSSQTKMHTRKSPLESMKVQTKMSSLHIAAIAAELQRELPGIIASSPDCFHFYLHRSTPFHFSLSLFHFPPLFRYHIESNPIPNAPIDQECESHRCTMWTRKHSCSNLGKRTKSASCSSKVVFAFI